MTKDQGGRGQSKADAYWRDFLTSGATDMEKRARRLLARLPHNPRCKACNSPFDGFGATIARILLGKQQSKIDPRFCNHCTDFIRENPGGAEINISILFADVRGSTALAEGRSPANSGSSSTAFIVKRPMFCWARTRLSIA